MIRIGGRWDKSHNIIINIWYFSYIFCLNSTIDLMCFTETSKSLHLHCRSARIELVTHLIFMPIFSATQQKGIAFNASLSIQNLLQCSLKFIVCNLENSSLCVLPDQFSGFLLFLPFSKSICPLWINVLLPLYQNAFLFFIMSQAE